MSTRLAFTIVALLRCAWASGLKNRRRRVSRVKCWIPARQEYRERRSRSPTSPRTLSA